MAANGTGGTVYQPNAPVKKKAKQHPSQHANTHEGVGTAHPHGRPYEWDNGSFHTRRQGKKFRSNYGSAGGGTDGNSGTGSTSAPGAGKPPKPKPVDPLTKLASKYANLAYGQQLGAINNDLSNVQPYFQDFINHVNQSNALYTQQSQGVLGQAQQQQQVAGQVAQGAEQDPEAQLAAQSRQALAGLGLMTLQSQVNANQGYFAGQAGPVAAAGQLQMQTNLGKEKRQVLADRGNYQATKREELRQTQHKNKLENAAFGLDVAQEQNKVATDAADRRQKNRQNRLDRQASNKADRVKGRQDRANYIAKYGIAPEKVADGLTPAERAQMKKYRQTGSTAATENQFTPTQRRASRSKVRSGIAAVKSQISVPGYKPDGFWDRAYKGLVNEKKYDPMLARAVIQVMKHGHVSPALRKKLHGEFGITGDAFKGKRTKLPPSASSVPVVGGIIGIGGI